MNKLKKQWPQLALLAVGLLWGSSNVFVKDAVSQIPPAFLIALRSTIAALLFSLLFWKRLRTLHRRDVLCGAAIGVCLFLAYYAQTCSMFFTTPGKCGFFASTYCVIVPFLYWLIARRRPSAHHLISAVLCVAGVVLCSVTESLSITWGDSAALVSGVFYALHMVVVEKLNKGRDPIAMTVLQFVFSAAAAWVVTLATETDRLALPASAMFNVLYLALVCTGLAMLLQNLGQKRVNPNRASILMSTESVFGVLFSVCLGYETLDLQTVLGFVLIFAAIVVSQLKAAPRGAKEAAKHS